MKVEIPATAKIKEHLNKSQDFLSSSIGAGSYPYSLNGKTPSTEATAWSAIALLHSQPHLTERLIAFLLANQNSDGGWSTGPGIGQSDWTSALALLALRITKHYQPDLINEKIFKQSLKKAANYLITDRNDFMFPVMRLLLFLGAKGPMGLQFGKGWPWNKNCYSWVEPTAYCLMALKLPYLIDDHLIKIAVQHAHTFLLDRACKGGGWNHGAFYCLGEYCPPYILTTAESLLSLIDIPENEQVKSGLNYLDKAHGEGFSAWSLSLSILALDAYGYDCSHNLNLLFNLQDKNGSFGSNYMITALSILALQTASGMNLFKPIKG